MPSEAATKWGDATRCEVRMLAILDRECALDGLSIYFEKQVSPSRRCKIEVSVHPTDVLPSHELITEIRRAIRLSNPKKEYKKTYNGETKWLVYSGATPYGWAELTIFGICRIKGTREKVIEATPEVRIPEHVIEARPERVETVTDYDCGFVEGEAVPATATDT